MYATVYVGSMNPLMVSLNSFGSSTLQKKGILNQMTLQILFKNYL